VRGGGRHAALLLLLTLLGAVCGVVPAAATPSTAQAALAGPRFVELTVGTVSPGVVTAATTALIVTGSLRNTGDRSVSDLEVRLQRAPAVTTAAGLTAALRAVPETFSATGPFHRVADRLEPGSSVDFALELPTTGGPGSSLALAGPGVYPVLVNVNGTPDFGNPARLDAAHLLLPVQGVPGSTPPSTTPPSTTPPSTPVAPPGVTLLWPLADTPRLLPVTPGSAPLLSDDDLATSLAEGGRLDGLLRAATTATSATADPTGQLGASLCLAVDPDLLATAEAMTTPGGYQVRTSTGTTAGTGTDAAARWLNRLRTAAADTCVTALPWARADLNASARAGLATQERLAVTGGAAQVARVTGADSLPTLTWPVDGVLTDTAAADLQAMGQTSVLLSAAAVSAAGGAQLDPTTRTARVPAGAGTLGAALLDPPTATALAATGSNPVTGGADTSTTDRASALQDALGALSWPSLVGLGGDGTAAGAPTSVVVAPPQLWTADATEATAVIGAVGGLLTAGLATARPLESLVAGTQTATTTAALAYPVGAAAAELTATTTDAVAGTAGAVADLAEATTTDVQAQVDPITLTDPLQLDLVRSLSRAPDAPPASGVADVLSNLKAQVQLQAPGGPYTLASETSPLLLVVRNGLPVTVDVRIAVTGPPGLTVTDTGVQQLPANSSRQLMLPTSVGRTGQFAVDVTLTTSGGQSLGPATRVLVLSTAYGTATAAVTGAAALLLLVLVGRRLWHRFRGQDDPADEGRQP
jgi:hypothetical protein